MDRAHSFDLADDEFPLEDIYGNVDFDFDLSGYHSEANNILQSFVKKEVIKSTLKDRYKKIADIAASPDKHIERVSEKVKETIDKRRNLLKKALKVRKQKLEEKLSAPTFLQTSDKIAFTLALIILCVTEYVILKEPTLMAYWYTALIFPLLSLRYYFYSRAKYQYFMIDFCYFAQIILLVYIHFLNTYPNVFQVAFALANGPLAIGAVMWRNSLVFHDLDKLTSVFIHIFPALVTFCLRWYPKDGDLSAVCSTPACSMSFSNAFLFSLLYYLAWQGFYLLQTEVIDKKKLDLDEELMTSARWMSKVKPHPIWVYLRKRGVSEKKAAFALVGTQFLYTILTLLPIMPIFSYFYLHCLYLAGVMLTCVWNGANFYFDVFSETYSKRLSRYLKDVNKEIKKKGSSNDSESSSAKAAATATPPKASVDALKVQELKEVDLKASPANSEHTDGNEDNELRQRVPRATSQSEQ